MLYKKPINRQQQHYEQEQEHHQITFVVDDKVEPTSYSGIRTRKFDYSKLVGNTDPNRYIQREQKEPVVIRSSIKQNDMVWLGHNSFVKSAVMAYSNHLHLVIRPDDVWLALITQFSYYVNGNAELLRDKFVTFDGKRELRVSAGGSLFSAPYEELTLMMSDKIAENIKDASIRDWVLPGFTTTTATDKIVGTIALMSTTKAYFDFVFELECGLPKVTLLGSVDDWKLIRQRLEGFLTFDTKDGHMKRWVDMLLPVLDHMVRSAEGNPDVAWWNRIAHKREGGSGPTWLSGWITTFMAFDEDGKWQADVPKVTVPFGEEPGEFDSPWPIIDSQHIPRGFVSCPLKIDDNGTVYDTDIYSGHIVSKLINNQTTIVPQLDWCLLLSSK
ncbi:hypothetical protein SAMD00019534_089540 [Acytostelium subglobosum LB1]|uniref:hypothetical protein n=1 Tax=Acytostelium subglobosum LB1 TaxID=1410327 RepID=UPI000644E3B0|nr:hypothetical protein SAMD00019534_089540 [Acytostelium subglobosum LB1]GAM25779.1 hypothetical protein SAMD00019534_089540 [Acytostelium subglobosum LB1]|eukprot:XP_012751297.1 hypothetical protein SAMD00019534_089540 [Acytostelium subglobosum LB1]